MPYLVLRPVDDNTIQAYVRHWLSEAGGVLSLEEVKNRMRERFGYITFNIKRYPGNSRGKNIYPFFFTILSFFLSPFYKLAE